MDEKVKLKEKLAILERLHSKLVELFECQEDLCARRYKQLRYRLFARNLVAGLPSRKSDGER